MPYEVASASIAPVLVGLLEGDSTVASRIKTRPAARGGGPAIYTDGDVPQGALMPYLTIGAWTQVPFHSLTPDDPDASPSTSAYGWNCTVMIKAVGQQSAVLIQRALSAALRVLYHGRRLSVDGYGSAWCDECTVQPTMVTNQSGVITYEVPAILRVYVHDA